MCNPAQTTQAKYRLPASGHFENFSVSKGVDIIVDDDNNPIKFPSIPELDYDYNGAKHIHYHFHNHNGKPCAENHDEDIKVNMF